MFLSFRYSLVICGSLLFDWERYSITYQSIRTVNDWEWHAISNCLRIWNITLLSASFINLCPCHKMKFYVYHQQTSYTEHCLHNDVWWQSNAPVNQIIIGLGHGFSPVVNWNPRSNFGGNLMQKYEDFYSMKCIGNIVCKLGAILFHP